MLMVKVLAYPLHKSQREPEAMTSSRPQGSGTDTEEPNTFFLTVSRRTRGSSESV